MSNIDDLEDYLDGFKADCAAVSTKQRRWAIKRHEAALHNAAVTSRENSKKARFQSVGHRPEPSLPRLKFLERD